MIHSLEAEQSVLGSILIDNSVIDQLLDKVSAEDFFNDGHRFLFEAMTNLSNTNQLIDPISLGDEIQKLGGNYNLHYAMELSQQTPSSANASTYASIVRDKAKRRNLANLLSECKSFVESDREMPINEIAATVAAQIGAVELSGAEGIRNTKEVLKSLTDAWRRRMDAKGGIDGLATGLSALDDRFLGWKAGNLIVAAGRPSMGKSVLGMQIAYHNAIKSNKRSLVFSLEMTAEELIERATASTGSIHLDVFRKGDAEKWGEHSSSIQMAIKTVAECPVLIDDTAGLHINQICARARAENRKHKLDLVVVDHIHIVNATAQSREREMASITGSLKALAKELGCPVLAIAQLNRGVEQRPDKRPTMSDLRDSGSIEQDADAVLLLYRDDYYYKEQSMNPGVIEIITGKHRGGETGTDYCSAQLHMSKIIDQVPNFQINEAPAKNRRGFNG
jgi:replicative DNA helicase